jgi:hypothetical protein
MGVSADRPASESLFSPILVQRERWSGSSGNKGVPLVSPGQEVLPDQPVLRLSPTRSGELPRVGSGNGRGDELLPAGLRGHVSALTNRGGVVIESQVLRLPGTLGVGRQVAGVLTLWQQGNSSARQMIPPGAILVVPGALSFALLRQAIISGIAGIVASSIALHDLEGFLRTDLLKLLSSDQNELELSQTHLPPMTLLFTAGLASYAMPAQFVALLSRYEGSIVLLNGQTSLRQRQFPELLISLPPEETKSGQMTLWNRATELVPGTLVHISAGPHKGKLGIIDYLFVYGQKFPSGVRARAARIQCEDGSYCTVPLLAVERVR